VCARECRCTGTEGQGFLLSKGQDFLSVHVSVCMCVRASAGAQVLRGRAS
jgi:hypothetical protein